MFTTEKALVWLERCHAALASAQDRLTDLDREIGDADHGLNMNRGFSKVAEKLATLQDASLATVLKTVGMTLLSSVGGASGPLYGTFFLKASQTVGERTALDTAALADLLEKAAAGVAERGKAVAGDKTMIDAWGPMVTALKAALASGASEADAMGAMVTAGRQAVADTAPMIARKGRASYLGPRSVGHVDPGAASSLILAEALAETLVATEAV